MLLTLHEYGMIEKAFIVPIFRFITPLILSTGLKYKEAALFCMLISFIMTNNLYDRYQVMFFTLLYANIDFILSWQP